MFSFDRRCCARFTVTINTILFVLMASWNIKNSLNWCWGVRLKKIISILSFPWWNFCFFSITNIKHESHQGNSPHSSRREARVDFTSQMVTLLARSVNYSPRQYASSPPLWSSGQSFWLWIQRSRVRSPALPDFLTDSGSGTGSTQPREVNWGATWIK
jgi:hypothetical protein